MQCAWVQRYVSGGEKNYLCLDLEIFKRLAAAASKSINIECFLSLFTSILFCGANSSALVVNSHPDDNIFVVQLFIVRAGFNHALCMLFFDGLKN